MSCVVVLGEKGSNKCPSGYARITDFDSCGKASAALQARNPESRIIHANTNGYSDGDFPSGCIYLFNFELASMTVLNNAQNGKGAPIVYLVCQCEFVAESRLCLCASCMPVCLLTYQSCKQMNPVVTTTAATTGCMRICMYLCVCVCVFYLCVRVRACVCVCI